MSPGPVDRLDRVGEVQRSRIARRANLDRSLQDRDLLGPIRFIGLPDGEHQHPALWVTGHPDTGAPVSMSVKECHRAVVIEFNLSRSPVRLGKVEEPFADERVTRRRGGVLGQRLGGHSLTRGQRHASAEPALRRREEILGRHGTRHSEQNGKAHEQRAGYEREAVATDHGELLVYETLGQMTFGTVTVITLYRSRAAMNNIGDRSKSCDEARAKSSKRGVR